MTLQDYKIVLKWLATEIKRQDTIFPGSDYGERLKREEEMVKSVFESKIQEAITEIKFSK